MIPIQTKKHNDKIMLQDKISKLEEKEELTFSERIELKQLKTKLYHKHTKVE